MHTNYTNKLLNFYFISIISINSYISIDLELFQTAQTKLLIKCQLCQ